MNFLITKTANYFGKLIDVEQNPAKGREEQKPTDIVR